MNRRHFFTVVLGALGGCSSPTGGENGSGEAPGTQLSESPTATPTDTDPCQPVDYGFPAPDIEPPNDLDEETSIGVAYDFETAYQGSFEFSPEDLSGIPDDVGPYDYDMKLGLADAFAMEEGYSVTLEAIVSYTVTSRDDGTTNEVSYDKPVSVSRYTVTKEYVEREAGIGDLTGVLHCW